MTTQERLDEIKAEMERTIHGTEEFMILLVERDKLEREKLKEGE